MEVDGRRDPRVPRGVGTFYYHGELVFWDVREPEKTIIVSLNHERYKKLILEVADPEQVVSRVRAALHK